MPKRNLQARADFGALLTRLRQEHDPPLNQTQAAKLAGINPRNWGNIERGHTAPALRTVIRISEAFGISTQDLLQSIPGTEEDDTGPASRADVLRLEHKIDQLLDNFGLTRVPTPDEVADETEKAIPQPPDTPARRAPKRRKPPRSAPG